MGREREKEREREREKGYSINNIHVSNSTVSTCTLKNELFCNVLLSFLLQRRGELSSLNKVGHIGQCLLQGIGKGRLDIIRLTSFELSTSICVVM